jgi:hypothetical protein
LHDFFFENQATLIASNLEERTMDFVGSLTGINGSRLLECVHGRQAEAKITEVWEGDALKIYPNTKSVTQEAWPAGVK